MRARRRASRARARVAIDKQSFLSERFTARDERYAT